MDQRLDHSVLTEVTAVYRDFLMKEFKGFAQEVFDEVVRKVDDTFATFNNTLHSLKTSINGIKSMQSSIIEKVQNSSKDVMQLHDRYLAHEDRLRELGTVSNRIHHLEEDLHRLERWNCKNNILISNVPRTAAEDCHQIVRKLFEKVGLPMHTNDVVYCKRIKSTNRKKISPILVKLVTHRSKERLFQALGNQRVDVSDLGIQQNGRIYVNDHVSRMPGKISTATQKHSTSFRYSKAPTPVY